MRPVGVTAHVFDELGATSIRMADYCTRLRRYPGLEAVRISDIYCHPSIRALAAALGPAATGGGAGGLPSELPAAAIAAATGAPRRYPRAGALRWTLCGLYQLLVLLG